MKKFSYWLCFALTAVPPTANADENLVIERNKSLQVKACTHSQLPQTAEIFISSARTGKPINIERLSLQNECKELTIPAVQFVTKLMVRGSYEPSQGYSSESSTSKTLVALPGDHFLIGFDNADFVSLSNWNYTDLSVDIKVVESANSSSKPPESVLGCPSDSTSPPCMDIDVSVSKNFTTAPVKRLISGRHFEVPANFISNGSYPVPLSGSDSKFSIYLRMPDFAGATIDSWRKANPKSGISVGISAAADQRKYFEAGDAAIEAYIKSNAPISKALGFSAYLHDYRKTSADQSIPVYIARKSGEGDHAQIHCKQPKHGDGNCELAILDTANNLFIRARFDVEYARQWLKIESHLRELLSSWLVGSGTDSGDAAK
ncbi:MAG: hypothetical protein IPO13_03945 [Rhodocyclaceae bacterium]|nr:hypothetical protein [Rhodocyclaceae bacterium]